MVQTKQERYRKYLQGKGWRAFKKRYRKSKRVPQDCVICGNKKVHLHHKTYSRLGSERFNDVVPLCAKHHMGFHNEFGTKNLWNNTLKYIKREKQNYELVE